MTQAIVRDAIHKRRRFEPEIIQTVVRWYIAYRLSYRDLVELMVDRGVKVSHTTLHR